jgi:hypothetical protein
MKKVVLLVLIVGFGIVTYLLWFKPKQNTAAAPVQITGTAEEKEATINNKIAESKADLRFLHTALEAWKVDNKTYPDNLFILSTPIAYLGRVPIDPFTQNAVFNYKKISDIDFILWGIGPDGKNDDGQIIYDLNNGITSSGDIVRTPTSQ